jgi:hypothetical protein
LLSQGAKFQNEIPAFLSKGTSFDRGYPTESGSSI